MDTGERIYSILIVDDSPESVDALSSMLVSRYKIYTAGNGKAALRILDKLNPDLLLLDVVMPEMDGFEVLTRLNERSGHPYLPVIFITGDTDAFSEARGLRLGAVDYIAKPYNPDIVGIKVRNQLENKLHREHLESLVERRTQELVTTQKALILGMSLMAESRDQNTGDHLVSMSRYVGFLAQAVHRDFPDLLSPADCKRLVMLSPLHDIGKVAISDTILNKNGPLTAEEFELCKAHTTIGADILRKTQTLMEGHGFVLDDAIAIAESHHEKCDGTGYPNRLKGNEIPLYARIVALADVYDALTSRRPYKDAYAHDQARDIIVNGDGRTSPEHFDPLILDIFRSIHEEFKK